MREKTAAELLDCLAWVHNAAVDAREDMDGDKDRQYLLEELCRRIFAITRPIFDTESVTRQA